MNIIENTPISNLQIKSSIRAFFGADKTYCQLQKNSIDLYLKLSTFGKNKAEYLQSESGRYYEKFGFHIIENESRIIGVLVQEIEFPLEPQSYLIYLNFLKLTQDWNLWRVWNYVPFINEKTEELENYRSFCKGRSLAFEEFYGDNFEFKLPAASAVGINDNKLVIYFIGGKQSGSHIENHEQIPAFKYPKKYGPKSPSFARGTLVSQAQRQTGYISGTASIKGSESVTLQTIAQQLHTTIDNISIVCEKMGFVERMSFDSPMPSPAKYTRKFKVYIRKQEDFSYIEQEFSKIILLNPQDQIIYLQSDICRSNLDIEIEAVIENRKSSISTVNQLCKEKHRLEQLLAQTVEQFPLKIAIVYNQERLTYQELYDQVIGLCKRLSMLGVKPKDCVMMLLPNCPEFVSSIFATAKLGAIALPINPQLQENLIQYYVEDSHPKVIITDSTGVELCRQIITKYAHKIELILIDTVKSSSQCFNNFVKSDDCRESSRNSCDSTDRAKKLCTTHKHLFHETQNYTQSLKITAEDNILAMVPMYQAYGFEVCMLASISNGATLVILETAIQDGKAVEMPLLFRQSRILELIEREKITILPIVPYIASILAEIPKELCTNLSSLRLCLCAGKFLSKDIFDRFQKRFALPLRQLYPSTEVGASTACVRKK
ncbi:MAG: AMP-binding protein [Cyanobacteria bacterium J06633_8]